MKLKTVYWNLEVFLVLLESPWQVRFNRVYFTIFRAKVWKILNFEWILSLKIQTNCKNWVWKENSVEPSYYMFTLGPTIQVTLIYLWRKVICLFVVKDLQNNASSSCSLGRVGKCALSWSHNVLTYGGEDIEYWRKKSTKKII